MLNHRARISQAISMLLLIKSRHKGNGGYIAGQIHSFSWHTALRQSVFGLSLSVMRVSLHSYDRGFG